MHGERPMYYHRNGTVAEAYLGSWETGDPDYKRVAETNIGDTRISTVFLCLDHQYGEGAPLIFETMLFGGEWGNERELYATEAEALAGHQRWVDIVTLDSHA